MVVICSIITNIIDKSHLCIKLEALFSNEEDEEKIQGLLKIYSLQTAKEGLKLNDTNKALVAPLFTKLYDILSQTECSDQVQIITDTTNYLVFLYQNQAELRQLLLDNLMLLIFTLIQHKSLPGPFRSAQVEHIFKLF